jgi:peptidoglycan/xylan/chitin deacetylase (PgdA/CDA1 family)
MTRLPILMYHNVSESSDSKGLTIWKNKLEAQLQYLSNANFTTYHFADLENRSSINSKSVMITFDDVTVNQLVYAVPLLKKYNLKATFFIPIGYIGAADLWNSGEEKIMSLEQLKMLDPLVELGFHSFAHKRYSDLTKEEIYSDFAKCFEGVKSSGLQVYSALAYPYGNYPKKGAANTDFVQALKDNKIKAGLRIGNRINKFPFKDPYAIQRIDVKGEDSLLRFKLKLRFGKLKLF